MIWENGKIKNFEMVNGLRAVGFKKPNRIIMPGQTFLIYSPATDIIIHRFVVGKIEGEQIWLCGAIPERWQIGQNIFLRGPIGSGFNLLPHARNVLLASLDEIGGALFPLVDYGLTQYNNIAYALSDGWTGLPVEIELLKISEICENLDWADCCYLEVDRKALPVFEKMLRSMLIHKNKIQLFIHTPVLCYGQAECYVCSIKTKKEMVKTCKQGNVFWLGDLEEF